MRLERREFLKDGWEEGEKQELRHALKGGREAKLILIIIL